MSTAACRSSPIFRSSATCSVTTALSEERRELLIILTPQIIYNKMDSDLVKQIESSRMSWILSDVINLHGEAGLRSRCDEWYDGEMESIYPNVVPEEGVLPLSSGQLAPGGVPALCPPGMEQVVPERARGNQRRRTGAHARHPAVAQFGSADQRALRCEPANRRRAAGVLPANPSATCAGDDVTLVTLELYLAER